MEKTRSGGAPDHNGALRAVARKRFFIIGNCALIAQNRSPFCQSQLTRETAFMTTLVVYYSCMITVKYRF